jgi:mitochondrial fission protein ELM1
VATQNLVVWQLSDGKRGHERQVEGLIDALAERETVDHHCITLQPAGLRPMLDAAVGHFSAGSELPRPALIIAAGRACQWPLIAARRASGGRSIYLMRPGLPRRCFDLCIIPRHDRPAAAANVIISEGPLNPMRPAARKLPTLGVILLGGPSAHHAWDSAAVVKQIELIIAAEPTIAWQVSNSRRTPRDFRSALSASKVVEQCFTPFDQRPADWLQSTLAQATCAWVSADSVAMIYEALSAGATLGLIDVPPRRDDRITRIAGDLRARGWVRQLGGVPLATSSPTLLHEAGRCADLVFARWPELRNAGGDA